MKKVIDLKDSQRNIQYFGIDFNELEALARAGAGKLVTLTANNSDIKNLLSEQQVSTTKESKEQSANIFWQDEGIYFIWLVTILSIFLFRRGILERVCR